jgi:hypothetical protein
MKATCLIGTWNVATRYPKESEIDIHHFIKQSLSPSPDFLVFGFQELLHQLRVIHIPPTQQSYWQKNTDLERFGDQYISGFENWIQIIITNVERIHGQGARYKPIWAGRRAALGLFVMAKESIEPLHIFSGSIGTGLLGLYGNKGAICVALECEMERFPQSRVSLSFINCHLGPHQGEYYCIWRQQETDHILACLQLRPLPSPKSPAQITVSPDQSQVVYLFGDLNYRFKGSRPDWTMARGGLEGLPQHDDVLALIKDQHIHKLLEMDELIFLREKQLGLLSFFSEARINWLPSYKLIQKPNRGYSKKRLPAYCDRILYSTRKGEVKNILYTKIDNYDWSDHDPVIGMFLMEFQTEFEGYRHMKVSVIGPRIYRFWNINKYYIGILALLILLRIFLK